MSNILVFCFGYVIFVQWWQVYCGMLFVLDLVVLLVVCVSVVVVVVIVVKGVLVYGINIGFGKLVSVCIECEDLVILQWNIVFLYVVGVGELMLVSVVWLMMVLKLVSLVQGVLGVCEEILLLFEVMLVKGVLFVVLV